MKKYYTETVSDEVFNALYKIGYPLFEHSNDSIVIPSSSNLRPTYAEVLDWMIEKGIDISIYHPSDDFTSSIDEFKERETESHHSTRRNSDFCKLLDESILVAITFIELDNDKVE